MLLPKTVCSIVQVNLHVHIWCTCNNVWPLSLASVIAALKNGFVLRRAARLDSEDDDSKPIIVGSQS